MKKIGIYRIKNVVTKKSYVGSSLDIESRFYQHKYLLKRNKSHSPKLQASYNKHGCESFQFEVLQQCEVEYLKDTELEWIDKLDSVNNGYNCSNDTNCSTRGRKHTDESKNKMSESQKKITGSKERIEISIKNLKKASDQRRGNKLTDEHKKKIGVSNSNKVRSEEYRKYLSKRMKENPIKYWLGKKMSVESRKKMSESHIGKPVPHLMKSIQQFNSDMELLNTFDSTLGASLILGISRTSIKNCLNGYSKTAGGFIFKKC